MFSFVYPGDVTTKNMVQKILRTGPSRCFLLLYFTCTLNLYSSSLLVNWSFSQKDVLRSCGGGDRVDRKKPASHCFRSIECPE